MSVVGIVKKIAIPNFYLLIAQMNSPTDGWQVWEKNMLDPKKRVMALKNRAFCLCYVILPIFFFFMKIHDAMI